MNKHILLEAANEITHLRQRNELLQAKVDVIEVFATAMGMRNIQQGASIDIVWSLRKEAESIKE